MTVAKLVGGKPKQNEALVKKRIRALLDQYGVYYAMPVAGSFGRAGIPDFLCCVNGWFLAIEAKSGAGKASKLQLLQIAKIVTAGGMAVVINEDTFGDLEELVKKYAGPQAIKEPRTKAP